MSNVNKHLSIIKPDAVERNLGEDIKNIFIKNNLKIKDSKKIHIPKKRLQNFIKFIKQNLSMMIYVHILSSGPIFVMILEGENAVAK